MARAAAALGFTGCEPRGQRWDVGLWLALTQVRNLSLDSQLKAVCILASVLCRSPGNFLLSCAALGLTTRSYRFFKYQLCHRTVEFVQDNGAESQG